MWLDRNELVSLDLKLTSDYGDIIPKIQIGYDLFNLIEHNTSKLHNKIQSEKTGQHLFRLKETA